MSIHQPFSSLSSSLHYFNNALWESAFVLQCLYSHSQEFCVSYSDVILWNSMNVKMMHIILYTLQPYEIIPACWQVGACASADPQLTAYFSYFVNFGPSLHISKLL